jgi:hypothetical protein
MKSEHAILIQILPLWLFGLKSVYPLYLPVGLVCKMCFNLLRLEWLLFHIRSFKIRYFLVIYWLLINRVIFIKLLWLIIESSKMFNRIFYLRIWFLFNYFIFVYTTCKWLYLILLVLNLESILLYRLNIH